MRHTRALYSIKILYGVAPVQSSELKTQSLRAHGYMSCHVWLTARLLASGVGVTTFICHLSYCHFHCQLSAFSLSAVRISRPKPPVLESRHLQLQALSASVARHERLGARCLVLSHRVGVQPAPDGTETEMPWAVRLAAPPHATPEEVVLAQPCHQRRRCDHCRRRHSSSDQICPPVRHAKASRHSGARRRSERKAARTLARSRKRQWICLDQSAWR